MVMARAVMLLQYNKIESSLNVKQKKVSISLSHVVEAHKAVRRRSSHNF
jgi:hypothetical protein